jgi:hypothetical protein
VENATCANCHTQIDRAAMKEHTLAFGSSCLNCHDGIDTFDSTFDHGKVPFALTGMHTAVKDPTGKASLTPECKGCHLNQTTLAQVKMTPTDCASCHKKDDAHENILGTDCAACHATSGWKPSSFDHSTIAFQLTGKHASTACADCHKDKLFAGTPTNCAACHQKDDSHQGKLGAICQSCHTTDGWKPATFNHQNASFKLIGAHQQAACTACHQDKTFRNAPTSCAGCHQKDDAHKGGLGTDCAQCHSPSAWKPSTFNHANSAFPLTGQHQSVQCAACHANAVFKGTPNNCAACHQKDDHHNGQFGADCASCHNTSAWRPANFTGAHSFPMNHGGANTCRSCHPSTLNAYTCYTCHNQNQMIQKHQEEKIADLSNCVKCHPGGRGDD